ncbi:transposase [Pedobacter sp. UYP30]|uniref:hypothetical protein n=1 Tax=Pedobacter sp. UYP30 TaxID=1756400 RepID=UPI003397C830
MSYRRKTIAELLELKLEAKKLFVHEGKTNREISKLIDVSENSLTVWSKLYNWSADREKVFNNKMKCADEVEIIKIFEAFKHYSRTVIPEQIQELPTEITDFLNLIKKP